LDAYKQEVDFRTDRLQAPFGAPQLSNAAVRFEVSEKTHAVAHGGLALIHQIAHQSGLVDALNAVSVLKLKLPYYESDHILNISYNFLCGGTALEHIEYRRQDPTHLNMLGTHSLPDPWIEFFVSVCQTFIISFAIGHFKKSATLVLTCFDVFVSLWHDQGCDLLHL
jgi:hypothetical protein